MVSGTEWARLCVLFGMTDVFTPRGRSLGITHSGDTSLVFGLSFVCRLEGSTVDSTTVAFYS
eukprot:7545036-Pyramimonas_sp.AAC.1